ncbi:RHS repeat-associated core domain-containing protein [Vitiosangium sp. GDMCC 1.1324]|uniref:RHS repeat-associated core domain-containing protein n=1 Tax=Vitiosangium sp. (strain GDMCC 1.1324) TaxID=2138576 RepID=UPI0011B50232|nr:RHS repeat-associated core domain-containing protein [Vitiosangium sp. GDMCC 1.1324]
MDVSTIEQASFILNEGTYCEYPPELEGGGDECNDGFDNDHDGEVDEDCRDEEPDGGPPPSCVGPKCACGGTNKFDPVNIVTGTSFERVQDVEVADSVTTLSFERTFSSRADEWGTDAPLLGVPKPFGASVSNPNSVEWWHNWLSLVMEHANFWSVRDRDGRMLRFTPCTGGVPCQAAPSQSNPSQRERLWRTASGYELVQEDGSRLVFEARFVPADGGRNRYFLSRVQSPTGVVLATLNYAAPALANCPWGGVGSNPGVPYLSSVQTAAGSTLSFSYRLLTQLSGGAECVISAVSLGSPGGVDGGSTVPEVTYTYSRIGSLERSGRIAKAQYRARQEEYLYTLNPSSSYKVQDFRRTEQGVELVRHTYGTDNRVSSVTGGGSGVSLQWQSAVGTCQPGSNCCGKVPQVKQATDSLVGRGDGTETAASLTYTYETLSNYGQQLAPRLYRTTEACSPSQACSAGSERTEWTCSAAGMPGHEAARKDKRDNWEVYGYSMSSEAQPRLERTSVKRGASDMFGTGALEEQTFSYTYGANGEQLPQATEEQSVLGGTGARKRTASVYDESGRQKAVIESGWTLVRNGDGSWTPTRRFVGTFNFTSHISSGESIPDPLGRTMEVHGPCVVSSESATDCSAAGDYSLTRYDYYPSTAAESVRNRLQKVSVYPTRTSTAPLTTEYLAYDARGHVTSVKDANGVVTGFTYEEDRLLQTVMNGQSTQYGYADGRNLTSVQSPAGNAEVFCYRTGTSGEACTGGTLTEKLQWKARAASTDGTGWTEKVVYTYWPDGTLKEERYLARTGATSETRRVLKYAADAHKRPTWQKWGDGAGSFTTAKSFDGADNPTGVGLPFNNPPAWCGGVKADGTPLSQLCSSMSYDRANRLVQVDEYPADGVAQRTLFDYDVQGNVTGVKVGCLATDSFGSCGQPAATYKYDDFGKVVEVALPHADGPVRYAYDVLGNVVVKETEAMRQAHEYVSYSYDMLSRPVSAQRVYETGTETLYRFGYDSQGTSPSGCPALTYTMGRTRYREDSFGQTWYQYDPQGRVLGEVRVRAGQTTCGTVVNANPHTYYTYSANGNLASVTYPNGRTVTYVYGTGANADRVAAVDVTLYDGTVWTTKRLLSNVAWEPYGGLRGYTLTHPTTGTTSTVEYGLGDNGSVAPTGCSTTFPSVASSDLTGRLRSLRVSSGAMAMGTGAGDIYQRTYTWKADQVVRTDTCLLGASAPRTESYGYDRTLRLTGMQWSAESITGGYGFGYDGRGNRTSMNIDGSSYNMSYAAAPRGDRLTGWSSSASNSLWGYTLAYDAEGRVTRKEGAKTLDGQPTYTLGFRYGQSVGVATETVFRAVEVNGVFYNYYYDAQGRRRSKSYPGGTSDEFFHDMSSKMLVDRGSSSTTTPVAHYTQDDYVWLGGRPVAMVRGKLSNTWIRLSDSSTDCSRNGEASACGVYFPVTDHIGKPVLMLDGAGRVAGAVDYEPFGQANRVALHAETGHPLPTMGSPYTMAELRQPTSASTQVKMRVLFHLLDTKGQGHLNLVDGTDGRTLSDAIDSSEQGHFWSGWVQPSAGYAKVRFTYTTSCPVICNDLFCHEDCTTESFAGTQANSSSSTSTGVVMEAYEYQRYQTGAQPFWTPLRFPGQYYDAETDLFENWNRYYDPSIGRYLQPEPILQDPQSHLRYARLGHGLPVYVFALSNALAFSDPTGLDIYMCSKPLDALVPYGGGSDKTARRSYPYVFFLPLYHQFYCVTAPNGELKCFGKTSANGGASGPGVPSRDEYVPERCDRVDDSNGCFEQCMFDMGMNPGDRMDYSLGLRDCQEWVGYANKMCRLRCKM